MIGRFGILLCVVGIGALLLLAFLAYRRRTVTGPDRLDLGDLGLELMSGCCAFVVFTTPSCAPCKTAVRSITPLIENARGMTELVTIDAVDHADVAVRYEVRSVPTVFLITASGHVVERWNRVPETEELTAALSGPLSAPDPAPGRRTRGGK